jgi:ABC-2 type transport system ATP-binding protein
VLSDVEMLCDRIAIINKGQVVARGTLDELLRREVRRVRVQVTGLSSDLERELVREGLSVRRVDEMAHLTLEGDQEVGALLTRLLAAGVTVVEVEPERETLEDLFVRKAVSDGS